MKLRDKLRDILPVFEDRPLSQIILDQDGRYGFDGRKVLKTIAALVDTVEKLEQSSPVVPFSATPSLTEVEAKPKTEKES